MMPGRILFGSCPLCGCTEMVLVREAPCDWHSLYRDGLGRTMRWMNCLACGHVFVDGYFNPAALDLLFQGTHHDQRPGADVEGQRQVWARTVERVTDRLPRPPADWLDVGTGNGSLMFTAAEWGYRAVGLDLRPETVAALREWGYDCHLEDLLDHQPERPYQVLSMCDVLEHIPYPKAALRHARRLITDDGILVVSLPSYDSPAWRLIDREGRNPYWGELEHYHNFSRERLIALLAETGFGFVQYAVSPRWRVTMEVLARPRLSTPPED